MGGGNPWKDERAVIEQRKHKARAPYRVHGFGYKCRVEGVSSTIERVFGDYVTAKKFVDTAKEMVMKAFICNAERSSPVLKPLVGGRKEGLLIRRLMQHVRLSTTLYIVNRWNALGNAT